jgi:uncharacterized phage protein (TIGR01671 family)
MRAIRFRQFYHGSMEFFGFMDDGHRYNSFMSPVHCCNKKYPVMQFTGLQDKDGVDIYEDDIVDGVIHQDYSIHIGRVLYDYNGYRILTSTKSVQFTLTEKLTVIGNIHENKELLCAD